jgi:cobalt/nickel transport system permease protein
LNYFSKFNSIQLSFIDKCINKIAALIKNYFIIEHKTDDGLFQKLDSRIKLLFMFFFLIIISLKKDIQSEILILLIIFVLVISSKLRLLNFYKVVFFFSFIFGFLIALPSSLNFITKGKIIFPLLRLDGAIDFWIYHIPPEIGLTLEGLTATIMLTLRVINSLSISLLMVYTTPFAEIIRALKIFRIPDTFLMIISITYKYIFIFARTAEDIYFSMKSRITGSLTKNEMRNMIAGRMAYMFKKSRITCEEVFRAMSSRGFSNEIRIYSFNQMKLIDWFAGTVFLTTGILLLLK